MLLIALVVILVVLAVALGVAVHPFFWLILILALIALWFVFSSRRGTRV